MHHRSIEGITYPAVLQRLRTHPQIAEIYAGSGAISPVQRVEEGPSLSRVSSGESWLEITRDCADGSSDDLTDLEDTNLVSVAPRPEPRVVRSIRITDLASSSSIPSISIGGRRLDDSDSAPAGSRSVRSADAPEPTSMQRAHDACDAQEPGTAPVGIRMRTTATKDRPLERCTETSGAAEGSSCTAGQGEEHRDTEGALSMARVAAVCGVAPDSDLLWTFLAGMMLYFMSV